MYNRYIPQPDGTYRRNRMQDVSIPTERPPAPSTPPSLPQVPHREPESMPCNSCIHNHPPRKPSRPRPIRSGETGGVVSFLKKLLPQEFDTEDLIVVLLLLLMAGDCQENQNSALLTLVLYLFL